MDTVKEKKEFVPIAPEFYLIELLRGEGAQIKADNAVVTASGAVVFSQKDKAVAAFAAGRWVKFNWMTMTQPEAKAEAKAGEGA